MFRLLGIRLGLALVLTLSLITDLSAQKWKPNYVIKYVPNSVDREDDIFLNRLPKYILEGLDRLNQVDVISPYTYTSYPAQYYLEVTPSYLQHISTSYYCFSHLDPQKQIMYFEYRVNYGPKMMLTLGDIVTGKVLAFHELKTTSKFESEIIGFSYDTLGYKRGMSLEVVDQQRYTELVKPKIKKLFADKRLKAEAAAQNELYQAAKAVLFHLFPIRAQLQEFKPISRDTVEVKIPELDGYEFNRYQGFYVYLLRQFKDSTGAYERIASIGSITTTSQKGIFTAVNSERILSSLKGNETVYCSPVRLKYQSEPRELPPSIAFDIRTSGVEIDSFSLKKLYNSLNFQLFNVRGKKLTILDRDKIPAIQSQQNQNKSGFYLDKSFVAQYKSIGAKYILDVEIKELKASLDRSNAYVFNCIYVMRLIDVETSEISTEVNSDFLYSWSSIKLENYLPTIEYEFISRLRGKDQRNYIFRLGLSYLEFNIREVFNRAIPAKIVLNQITESEKEKAKVVFISGDFNEKIIDDDFHVCMKKEVLVDGQIDIRWEQIGRISLITSVGDGLARAKVKKGEKEIYAAFQKGEKLYCFDRPEWLIDGNYKWQLKKAGF